MSWLSDKLNKAVNLIDKGAKAAKEAYQTIKEKVKEKTQEVIQGIVNWAAESKKESNDFKNKINDESGIVKSNSRNVESHASIVSRFVKGMESCCNKIEQQCIELYSIHYEAMIESLDENEKEAVQRIIEEGEFNLKGTMSKYINKNISLDNVDFYRIIEISDSERKKNRLDEFQKDVLIEARNQFCKQMEVVLNSQNLAIHSYFNSQIQALRIRNKKIIEEFDQLKVIITQDESVKNNELIKRGVLIAQCDYVLNKL